MTSTVLISVPSPLAAETIEPGEEQHQAHGDDDDDGRDGIDLRREAFADRRVDFDRESRDPWRSQEVRDHKLIEADREGEERCGHHAWRHYRQRYAPKSLPG